MNRVEYHLENIKELWSKGHTTLNHGWIDLRPTVLSRVGLTKNGLIAEENPQNQQYAKSVTEPESSQRVLVIYPSVEHAPHFIQSSLNRRTEHLLSPHSWYPGAVGAMHVSLDDLGWGIHFIQGCFKARNPKSLTGNIVTKYVPFQKDLLMHLFEKAVEKNVKKIIIQNYDGAPKTNFELFRQVAEEHEFKVKEEEFGLSARKE